MKKLDIAKIENQLRPLLKHKSYNAFVESKDSYKYAEIINKQASYCLYCNIESIETIRKDVDKKGQRLKFDHFKQKNGTKENDLNCYNLVPSCHTCNSDYKGAKSLENTILNPLKEDFDELVRFDIDIASEQLGKFFEHNICFEYISSNTNMVTKAKQTIKVFNLEKRYNAENVKKELKVFFRDLKNTTKFKAKDYKLLNETEQEIKDGIFDIKNCEINKTKYGKLKKDLVNKYLNIN